MWDSTERAILRAAARIAAPFAMLRPSADRPGRRVPPPRTSASMPIHSMSFAALRGRRRRLFATAALAAHLLDELSTKLRAALVERTMLPSRVRRGASTGPRACRHVGTLLTR